MNIEKSTKLQKASKYGIRFLVITLMGILVTCSLVFSGVLGENEELFGGIAFGLFIFVPFVIFIVFLIVSAREAYRVRFEFEYKGHIVKVINKARKCTLYFDGHVIDEYIGFFIKNDVITLKGVVKINNEKAGIVFRCAEFFRIGVARVLIIEEDIVIDDNFKELFAARAKYIGKLEDWDYFVRNNKWYEPIKSLS